MGALGEEKWGTMTDDQTLVFLRHGKSTYPQGVGDELRPLAKRGKRQAKLSGEWINANFEPFDLILCSPATRTRETLEHAGLSGPVEYVEDLYTASHRVYLDVIARLGAGHKRVAVVGHAPAISSSALALTKNRTDEAARLMEAKYPTSGVAVLESKRPFEDLAADHMTLTDFYCPERPHMSHTKKSRHKVE